MRAFLGLLIIIFVFLQSSKKTKGKGARPGGGLSDARKGAASPGVDMEAVMNRVDRAVNRLDAALSSQAESPSADFRAAEARGEATGFGDAVLAEKDSARDAELIGGAAHAFEEGVSGLEDEECAGGSMAHTHTEGVSRSAHARRMAELDASSADAEAPAADVDLHDLRRAVVMAEVLGKPKALRRTF